jgi:hypothetical protein
VFEADSVTITVLVEKHPDYFGGIHRVLGLAGRRIPVSTRAGRRDLTAPGLTELEVATAMPTHSSGLRTHVQLCRDLSANYVQPAVGTVLHVAR